MPTIETEAGPLPARWAICCECHGEGASSAHLGAISQDDWEQWDYEDRERYLSGAYDKPCAACKGSGKVLEPVTDMSDYPGYREALKAYHDEQRDLAQLRADEASERRWLDGEY